MAAASNRGGTVAPARPRTTGGSSSVIASQNTYAPVLDALDRVTAWASCPTSYDVAEEMGCTTREAAARLRAAAKAGLVESWRPDEIMSDKNLYWRRVNT